MKKFILLILTTILYYSICRIFFTVYNFSFSDLLSLNVLFGGLRYDLSAIGYINLLFTLLYFLPFKFINNKKYQLFLKYLFIISNTVFILTNLIDLEYFKFTSKRSSFSMIIGDGMHVNAKELLLSFITEFWFLFIFGFVFLTSYIYIVSQIFKLNNNLHSYNIFKKISLGIVSITFLFVSGRGGLQRVPLKTTDSVKYISTEKSVLILNTPFTILRTMSKSKDIEQKNYYSEIELKKIFSVKREFNNNNLDKKNIVIIILESFGDENVGFEQNKKKLTPFLDSLITESYYFKNAQANGKLSIDAVPSVISGLPNLMNNSVISSHYAFNNIESLPKILKKLDYKTAFFHGAFNGSQNFDQYSKIIGFDDYYGKDQFPNFKEENFDKVWGIFDEEFLQFTSEKINTFKQPFFSTIFTISSHNPFTLPKKYEKIFTDKTNEYSATIAYTDMALRKFFDKSKKYDWYKNTLFIISADHTSGMQNNKTKLFDIPILFFDPSQKLKKEINYNTFEQIDILPSIMDYIGYKGSFNNMGQSLNKNKNYSINYLNGIYYYRKNDYLLLFDGKNPIELINLEKDSEGKNNLVNSERNIANQMLIFLKAYIQTYNDYMINNKF